jgi:HPr kinase/phosphorylase
MNEAMVSAKLRGSLVRVYGVGVFIRGLSGSGKSATAIKLMDRGHRLVADELVDITAAPDGTLVGRALEKAVRIEVRGLGIFEARSLFPHGVAESARIDFIADLDTYDPIRDSGRIEPETRTANVLDKEIPTVRVPVIESVDPSLLIEILARRFCDADTVKQS